MHIDLTGKVAVVTGGANGIGFATARRLATSGASVAIWDLVVDAGAAAAAALAGSSGDVAFFETDVTSRRSVEVALASTLTRFGGVDADPLRRRRHPHQQCRHHARRPIGEGQGRRRRRWHE